MKFVSGSYSNVLRFLWFDDVFSKQPNLIQLRFTRVVFGVSSSPFLLNATVHHNLEQYKETQPDLVEKLSKATYVDDIVTGADDEEQVYRLFVRSKEILHGGGGGFNLRKFCSNSALLQMRIDHQDSPSNQEDTNHDYTEETYTNSTLGSGQSVGAGERKVLGVHLDLATDQLVMSLDDISIAALKLEPTKRAIVSLVGRIYDPLGIMSPVVVQLKIFVQELCAAKIDWDQLLTGQQLERWQHLSSCLQEPKPLSIPYCYLDGIWRPSLFL